MEFFFRGTSTHPKSGPLSLFKKKNKMAEVAAKTQEAGAPEATAPTAMGELPPAGLTLVVAPAKAQKVGAPEKITPEGAIWLAVALAARATKTREAAALATPPRTLLATPCPPSSDKRGQPLLRSSASPGSSSGRLSPHLDADGFQLVMGRKGKERSGAKIPKKAREERERDESL